VRVCTRRQPATSVEQALRVNAIDPSNEFSSLPAAATGQLTHRHR
jgi:hypothetical protein